MAILLPLKKKYFFFYIGYLNVTILVLCLKKKIKNYKKIGHPGYLSWMSHHFCPPSGPLANGEKVSEPLGEKQGSHQVHVDMVKTSLRHKKTVPAGLWFDIVPWRAGMPCKSPPPEAQPDELRTYQLSRSLDTLVGKAPPASRHHGARLAGITTSSQMSVTLA